jgi:hypothetical protein
LLTVLQNGLLDVRLLVQDAELIVLVNKLNTHVVSGLAGRLILEDEGVHLLLEAVDDQVVLVTFVDALVDDAKLVLLNQFFLVEFSALLVSVLDLLSDLFAELLESHILVS